MLHLIKLCVGIDSAPELRAWQKKRLDEAKKKGKPAELVHITRQTPKRAEELLAGGSLYWVIKGRIAVRQKLIDLRAVTYQGAPHCALVYAPRMVAVVPRQHHPFQGWRYLKLGDAPPDLPIGKGKAIPPRLAEELAALGLL